MTHPVRGIKGPDLLGFDSTAVKNRIKGKKHCHWRGRLLEKDVFRAFVNIFVILPM